MTSSSKFPITQISGKNYTTMDYFAADSCHFNDNFCVFGPNFGKKFFCLQFKPVIKRRRVNIK